MKRSVKRLPIFFVFALALVLPGVMMPMPVRADDPEPAFDQNLITPFEFSDINPCTGEIIYVSGDLHVRAKLSYDANGGQHFQLAANYQGMSGYGQTTGLKYVAVSNQPIISNTITPQEEETLLLTQRFVSQGKEANFLFDVRFHLVTTANGDMKVTTDEFKIRCKG
ncbi:MAG TPA: hypothetical protein VE842_07730 [Pyrinomonadaceae bacterium]|jgi:hypothetical protein|nr:hypothetical protein [Pyrinomonadaceae bacterium]